MTGLKPELRLALSYGPGRLRAAFATILEFDAMLGNTVVSVREPILGRIRFAWWREQLESLPDASDVRDPPLIEVGRILCTHDVRNDQFVDLVNAWETLFEEEQQADEALLEHAESRGKALFRLAAGIAGLPMAPEIDAAGSLWGLVQLATQSTDARVKSAAFSHASDTEKTAYLLAPGMRPFAIMARFAERDLRARVSESSPRRIFQALGLVLGIR